MARLLFVVVILLFNMTMVGQENIKKVFPNLEQLTYLSLNINFDQTYTFNNNFILFSKGRTSTIASFDWSGNELFRYNIDKYIYSPSIAKEGEKISFSVKEIDPNRKYYEYDKIAKVINNKGVVVKEIKVSSHFTKISDDGEYLITTRNDDDLDRIGYFEIFKLSTNEKIKFPFDISYNHFHADFISINKVVALFHNIEYERGQKRGRERFIEKKNTEYFVIFNLESRTIELKTEIKFPGTGYFSSNSTHRSIWISPYEEIIFITGSSKPFLTKKSLASYALIAMTYTGEIIWARTFEEEKNDYEGIDQIEFINKDYLLVLKYGLNNSEFRIISSEFGNDVRNYALDLCMSVL